jgi:Ion channel
VNLTGFKDYFNAIWCTFITVMTSKFEFLDLILSIVGYGDFYPISLLGRIVTVFVMFWGNFLQSLIIVSIANLVEFDKNEASAYFQITNELAIIDSFHSASDLIKAFLRLQILKKKL